MTSNTSPTSSSSETSPELSADKSSCLEGFDFDCFEEWDDLADFALEGFPKSLPEYTLNPSMESQMKSGEESENSQALPSTV